MSTDRSVDVVRAIGIPDPRLAPLASLWTAETDWPEQGPRPSRPVDQGDSDLAVAAYGTRENSDTIITECVKAGSIDPISGAGFAWKEEGDALSRGKQAPTSIWGWNDIVYTDGSSTTDGDVNATSSPHAVTSSTGTVIVAYQASIYSTTAGADTYGVRVSRYTETSGAWAHTTVFTQTSAPANDFYPCLYIVPRASGDRVCLLYWVEDTDTQTLQVAMRYSDDDGATWTVGSIACLREPLYDGEVEGKRLRAAYRNGQVILFGQTVNQDASTAAISRDFIQQWASIDNGASFKLVVSGLGAEKSEGAYQDVCALPEGFLLAHVAAQSASLAGEPYIVVRHIPDAFTPFNGVPRYATTEGIASTVSANGAGYLQVAVGDVASAEVRHVPASAGVAASKFTYSRGDLSIVRAENGTLYMVTSCVSTYNTIAGVATTTYLEDETVVTRSVDGGYNWSTMGISDILPIEVDAAGRPRDKFPGSATLFRSQDTSTYLKDYAATWWRGRLMLAHRWNASPGNEDESLGMVAAGGYSTVNLPRTAIARNETTQAGWTLTWLPIELPGNTTGYTSVGAATQTLVSGALSLSASAQFAKFTNTDTTDGGYLFRGAVRVATGSAIGSTRVAVTATVGGTTTDLNIEVRFSTTQIQLYDVNAGAAIGSAVSVDVTQGVEFVGCVHPTGGVADGVAALWYRLRGVSDDMEYIEVANGAAQNDGATGATDEIAFGILSSDTADAFWYEFHWVSGANSGQHLETIADMANPDDLSPIPYSPTGVYVTDGVSLRATAGPAFLGDIHHIGATADYPKSRMFPSVFPSPRRGARTVDDSADVKVAIAYDSSLLGTAESAPLSDTMALAILGANWRTGYIERYDVGSASWVTVVTIDTATGLSWSTGNWTRHGNTIIAKAASGSGHANAYLEPNELAGATVEMAALAGPNNLRRIASNTEGTTDSNLAGRKAAVTFEGATNGELTSTVRFWMPNVVCWWNMLGETAAGWRLRIPAQNTVDGDIRVGTLLWCNVHPFGTPYSFGRALGQEHGVQVVEAEDRTYRTRTLAPSRRSVTMSWQDGVPTCNVSGVNPDPDYLFMSTSTGAVPVASSFDLPLMLRGLAEQVNGPALPVIYLPAMSKGPPDTTVFNRRKDFLVGVIDGDIQLDTVRGSENFSEFIRVASVRVLEVV